MVNRGLILLALVVSLCLAGRQSVEEISRKQLEALVEVEDYLAVFWYGKNCKTCDRTLALLETKMVDFDESGVEVVKVNDKKTAKLYGVVTFPGLTFFKAGKANTFEGDLSNGEEILDFMVSQEALDIPDRIEAVNAQQLEKLIEKKDFIAIFFYNGQPESLNSLKHLENIDAKADKMGIAFVKINDLELVDEYGLPGLPSLVYYRRQAPILYEGELHQESEILEWLIQTRTSGDDEDVIEEVSSSELETLISSVEHLAVLYYDDESRKADLLLENLEKIDDDCDQKAIQFVKISEDKAGDKYGIAHLPKLVFFNSNLPNIFEGELVDESEVLDWLLGQVHSDSIEEITGTMLDRLIQESRHLVVLFYDRAETESNSLIDILETVDDDLDKQDVLMVKLSDPREATEWGIDDTPAIVYFENGIPFLFKGKFESAETILEWLLDQIKGDQIEEVTDEMLDKMIAGQNGFVGAIFSSHNDVGVLIYDGEDFESERILAALETIDDDCDKYGIALVKIDDPTYAKANGIDKIPALVFFEKGLPNLFEGNLANDDEVLGWLLHQMQSDEIEEVTDEMLRVLITKHAHIAVVVYDPDDRSSDKVLAALETVDDDLDKGDVTLVKISNDNDLTFMGDLPELPAIVFYEDEVPSVFSGDEGRASAVLTWLIDKAHDEEEEDGYDVDEADNEAPRKAAKRGVRSITTKTVLPEETKPTKPPSKATKATKAKSMGGQVTQRTSPGATVSIPERKATIPRHVVKNDPEPSPKVKNEQVKSKADKPSSKIKIEEREAQIPIEEPRPKVEIEQSRAKVTIEKPRSKIKIEEPEAQIPIEEPRPKVEIEQLRPKVTIEKPRSKVAIEKSTPEEITDEPRPKITIDAGRPKVKIEEQPKVQVAPPKKPESIPKAMSENLGDEDLRPKVKVDMPKATRPKRKLPESVEPSKVPNEALKVKMAESLALTEVHERTVKHILPNEETYEESTVDIIAQQNQTSVIGELVQPEMSEDPLNVIDEAPNVVAFFYEHLDKVSTKIIAGLENVESQLQDKPIRFLEIDINEVPEITISSVPSLVFFKNGEPFIYEDNLMNEESILMWAQGEYQTNEEVIEDVSTEMIHDMVANHPYVLVFVYKAKCPKCQGAIQNLEGIDDDTDAVGVKFVKTDDMSFIKEFGIVQFPAVIYFENQNPSIYEGDPSEQDEMLTWLLYQLKEDTIENINRDLLFRLMTENEFLGVFFYSNNEESLKMLRHLELIDDEASEFGVRLVKIDDPLMAKKYGHRNPPGLGYFRHANYIKYDGELNDGEEILDWLTDPNIMEVSDTIEKVNTKMFEKLKSRNEHLAVIFYAEHDCMQCPQVLAEVEKIDDEAEASGIPIVKLEDRQMAKDVGVFGLPSIVIFRNFGDDAVIYAGDLKNEEAILEWLIVQKDPSNEAIEEKQGETLRKIIKRTESVGIFVYNHENCKTCLSVLQSLENIDDDCARHNIKLIKTTDPQFAEEVGISDFPGLVFFFNSVPNIYEGEMVAEEEVLDWLIEMKVESHIELITRPMLEMMVENVQYLVVFFVKQNCRTCDQVLVELEKIDDECDSFGIQMVKLQDPQLAKRYGIKTFPSLVYFRNGNPLTYEGDLKNEESVLEWLIDDDNRELEDEIEAVNLRMLEKLLDSSPFLAVFFHDEDCIECESILEALEHIDDEADLFGVDFVKIDETKAAKKYHVYRTPALVYFRKKLPVIYDGDLMDPDMVLEWLTSQDVFEIKDEIEEVNRRMLEKLLDKNDFVAVFFYDEKCPSCHRVSQGLEKIDQETDALDITFVKINDHRYAKKYGVNKLPALVYFRRKFPSIYRDDLFNEQEVLLWLKKNRFKHMELDLFMYSILALASAFILYTAFLLFGLHPKMDKSALEDEELTK